MSSEGQSLMRLRRKVRWSNDEDAQLIKGVELFGVGEWTQIAGMIPGRTGKQCRERWIGQLSPEVSKRGWTPEEDAILKQGHEMYGNEWTAIAKRLESRSAIAVKNRWNWLVRHGVVLSESRQLRRPVIFGPLSFDDGLFGMKFVEFQASMSVGP
jgi:hypothetical protein